MNGDFLLDTNIIIGLFAQDANIIQSLSQATHIFIPSVVLGELYYGAEKSTQTQRNLARVTLFAQTNAILSCDALTAQHYGSVKNHLKEIGRPIPENDIWIAALAQQHQLTLISRDQHFQAVAGLSTTVW